MNKSDSIGIPVYVVNTPRGAALYKRIERIHIERMKRNKAKEKLHSSDLELENESNKLEYDVISSMLVISIFAYPIAITTCAYFLYNFIFDFFFYH